MRSHPLSDQLPGEHTGNLAAISWSPSWHNEPIWNAHIPPIAIICQVLILLTNRGMEAGADPGFDQGGAPDRYRPKLPTVRSSVV